MGSSLLRQSLAKALFLHFDVPCVAAVPGHIVSLFALGSHTALVIDVGVTETTVLPVCRGLGLVKCWGSCALGASSVNR
jgi:actin-related protein 10